MTINTTVQCDALGCSNEREIEDSYDSSVTAAGWHTDPNDGFTHYCPRCWPKVKRELKEES